MEKRILPFIIVSLAVLLAFQSLQNWLNPPPPIVAEGEQEAAPDALAADEETNDEPTLSAEEPVPPEAAVDPEIDTAEAFDPDPLPDTPAADRPPSESRWVTLGSLASDSPYQMLVWLSSRGAAIECIAQQSPLHGPG